MAYNKLRSILGSKFRKLKLGYDAEKNPAVQHMLDEIDKLNNHIITFELNFDSDGNWVAEATNLPGLITGGTASDNINDMINDAIFTYFAIPPEYCDERILSEDYTRNHNRKSTHVYMFTGNLIKVAA